MGWRKPSRAAFAAKMVDALRKAGLEAGAEYVEERFQLRLPQGAVLNLENAYADYCAASLLGRARVVREYAQSFLQGLAELPETFDEARRNLLPRVRERAYHATLRLAAEIEKLEYPQPPLHDFARDPTLEVCYDTPVSIVSFDAEILAKWRVSPEDALEVATSNLRARSQEAFTRVRPGLFRSPWRDTHDVSRLQLPDLIRKLDVRGDPVVMVPGRNDLLVAGADDPDGQVAMGELARRLVEKEARFMTGYAFRLRGDRWERYRPAADSPAFEILRALEFATLDYDYGSQQEMLQRACEVRGDEVFVASLMIVAKEGEQMTMTAWTEGVPTLLPETDAIHFVRGGDVAGVARREHLLDVAADLVELTDDYPPRYRTRGFPSAEQLRAMGAT